MRKPIVTRPTISFLLVLGCVFLSYGFDSTRGERVNAQEDTGNYASVNGVDMYYEIHGSGEPIVLIHGGLGGVVEFAQLLPLLAETRQVIAVELQGHGHTADIDRPFSFEFMADDVAALIQELGFENADILGFSLGGGVALRTAIQHPDVVRKLVLVSTPYNRAGIHQEFRTGMEAMSAEAAGAMTETPMYQYYSSVAPNPEDWPTLVGKEGDLLRQDYNWSEEIAAITAPVLVLVGDSDFIPPTHAVELFGLLGGGIPGDFVGLPTSQLAVLPGTSHFTILSRTDLLLPIINPFLVAPMPE